MYLDLSIELLGTCCRVSTVAIELTHLPATLPCETCLRLLIVQFVPMKEVGSMSVRKKGRSLRTFTLSLQRLPQWELPCLRGYFLFLADLSCSYERGRFNVGKKGIGSVLTGGGEMLAAVFLMA